MSEKAITVIWSLDGRTNRADHIMIPIDWDWSHDDIIVECIMQKWPWKTRLSATQVAAEGYSLYAIIEGHPTIIY